MSRFHKKVFEAIETGPLVVRGYDVMLAEGLAVLLGVSRRAVLAAVEENPRRFPDDFAFAPEPQELELALRVGRRGSEDRKKRGKTLVFTGNGVTMLLSLLRSEKAIAVNIELIRQQTADSWGTFAVMFETLNRQGPGIGPYGF